MTDEISWKQKCKRVAEWLGVDSDSDVSMLCAFFDGRTGWPDYTRDDAAAWRLQRVLLREFYIEIGDGYVVDAADVTPLDTSPTVIAEHDDLNKALVLAACKLIDEGRELQK